MKILLINPPTPSTISNKEYYVPLSLLYLAAMVQKSGREIEILDLNTFKLEESDDLEKLYESIILKKLSDFQPSLIGITCLWSGHFPSVLNFSKIIKSSFKESKIVIGGIHPTIYPVEILTNCPSIDWIIIGEGETALTQLVGMMEDNHYEFEKIDGFAYRKNGKVVVNPKKCFIPNLDDIPFPAYDLINLKDYYHDTSKWHNPRNLSINASLPIISSRSCPMRCNFCSMFMVMGSRWRGRSPKNVVDEIQFLYEKYDHRHFSFMDDNLTIDKQHIIELCNNIVKRNLRIQFETPNGISTRFLDEEILDALVAAGLVRVSLAIESGSDFIRNQIIGKNLSREQILKIAQLTKKHHKELYTRAFFIMGFPEDSKETLEDTYRMIEEIDVDKPIVSNLLPFPGTRVFQQVLKDNLFTEEIDVSNLWRMDRFYFTGNKSFFVKPYNLELSELDEFRKRFDDLIKGLIEKKNNERELLYGKHYSE